MRDEILFVGKNTASICTMEGDIGDITREEALKKAKDGGTVFCLDVPQGIEFGIDMRTYSVGPQFRGVKMIPPHGFHLITCGNDIEQSGLFIELGPADVCVMQWDPSVEMLCLLKDTEQVGRLTHEVRQMEHDRFLGPYPLKTEQQWTGVSGFITQSVLLRAGIPPGTFIMAGGIDDEALGHNGARQVQPYFDGAARVAQFVQLDPRQRAQDSGRTGRELSQFFFDKSEWLGELLAHEYSTDASTSPEAELLGELQLSFLLFLRLSSLRALEQWKAGVHLLCACDSAIVTRQSLYVRLLCILRAQLALAPPDLFEDALSEDNFLRVALASLAERTECQSLTQVFREALAEFWEFLGGWFGMTPEALRAGAIEDDDEPVVVITE